ncbi:MAG: DNA-processing protein DprA [Gemmatimonadaceae bacterium]
MTLSIGDDRVAAFHLACARGMGPVAFRTAVAREGGAGAALERLTQSQLKDALTAAERLQHAAKEAGARILMQGDAEYPAAVLDLPDAPPFLFALGDVRTLQAPMIAIVGTRRASSYGERMARRLAGELSAAGVIVVSGLARGIDAAAHEAALASGGSTIAVVAGGVDCAHPPRHRALHEAIAVKGLVLGESPCGTAPRPGSFPRRNRIIAALGAATVVVEAGVPSGARLTADLAIDLGRAVGAVPGPVDSPTSVGTNTLIRDGAAVITSVADILMAAGIRVRPPVASVASTPAENGLAGQGALAQRVWQRLRREPASLDELVVDAGTAPREVMRALTSLEMAGLVVADASRYVAV